jgi:hypothetical protein
MAESAMSVMYDVKYVQHVADNAPRILVLENHLYEPIKSFCLLNLEMPVVLVSLGVTFAEFQYWGRFTVIRRGFF